jgi:hypothetical protein
MDLVNPQMLQMHNFYRFKQTFTDVLTQMSIIQKGLIKYKKINGITHV